MVPGQWLRVFVLLQSFRDLGCLKLCRHQRVAFFTVEVTIQSGEGEIVLNISRGKLNGLASHHMAFHKSKEG